jgi:hypothetical protein
MGEGVGGRCRLLLALVVAVGPGGAPLGAVHREEEAIWCVCWIKAARRKEAVLIAARSARITFEK